MTLAEYESINWKYMRKTRKIVFALPVFMLVIFGMNTCNSVAGINQNAESNITGSVLSLAILALFLGFLYYSIRRGFKKNYLNTPALAEGCTYTLTEESITMEGNSISSKQPWSTSFKQAVKIDKWMVLSSSGTTAYFLDTEKLVAPASISDMEETLKRKGVALKD